VHDLGVFKAVGMTPRQTITMVVSTVAGTGPVAGLASIPAGVTLHRDVLPVMGHAVQTALPVAVLDVYQALGSAPVPGPAGRSGYRGEVGQRIFAAGVHSGIAGSKHQ
jgi:hypothetical protein